MTEETQNEAPQGQPVQNQQGESATTPPSPPTPAHEETERATPEPDQDDQVVEGNDPEPEPTSQDVGEDVGAPDAPQDLPPQSVEADPEDTRSGPETPGV